MFIPSNTDIPLKESLAIERTSKQTKARLYFENSIQPILDKITDPLINQALKIKHKFSHDKLEPLPTQIDAKTLLKIDALTHKVENLAAHLHDDPWNNRLTVNEISFLLKVLLLAQDKRRGQIEPPLENLINILENNNLMLRSLNIIYPLTLDIGNKELRKNAHLFAIGSSKIKIPARLESDFASILLTPSSYPQPATTWNEIHLNSFGDVINAIQRDIPITNKEGLESYCKLLNQPDLMPNNYTNWPRIYITGTSLCSEGELYTHIHDRGGGEFIRLTQAIKKYGSLEKLISHIQDKSISSKELFILFKIAPPIQILQALQAIPEESRTKEVKLTLQFLEVLQGSKTYKENFLPPQPLQSIEAQKISALIQKMQIAKNNVIDWSSWESEDVSMFLNKIVPLTTKESLEYEEMPFGDLYELLHLLHNTPGLPSAIENSINVNASLNSSDLIIFSPKKLFAKVDFLLEKANEKALATLKSDQKLTLREYELLRSLDIFPTNWPIELREKIDKFRNKFFENEKEDFIHLAFADIGRAQKIEYKALQGKNIPLISKLKDNIFRYGHSNFKIGTTDPLNGYQTAQATSINAGGTYMHEVPYKRSFIHKEYRINTSALAKNVPTHLKSQFETIFKEELGLILKEKRDGMLLDDIQNKVSKRVIRSKLTRGEEVALSKVEFNNVMFCSEYCLTALVKATVNSYHRLQSAHPDNAEEVKMPKNMSFFGFSSRQKPNTVSPRLLRETLKQSGIIQNLSKKEYIRFKQFVSY